MFRLSSKKALGQELKCKVNLLVPGEEIEVGYTPNTSGQDLLNDVIRELDLLDKDYYGLKMHDQIQWLDLTKGVQKQTKGIDTVVFDLRFKYYPADPALLANESTRYYLYLQLRLDLIEGRLKADNQETLAYLIACVLQSELGDHTPSSSEDNYVSEFKFVPNQTEDLELAAIRSHQSEDFQGLKPADAELNFLKQSCRLDTYGIDPYPVKEGNSHNHFLIGVNYNGIATFQDSKKTNQFGWDEIERISLDNKLVLIYCRKESKKGSKSSKSRLLFGFRCPSQTYAQNFWKVSTEHRYFFTLESTPEIPIVTNTGGLFKKSHKLKYTGRVEKDLLRDHVDEGRASGVKRSHSLMSKSNDGTRWSGFQQSSANNLYASEFFNKTLPSNLNYFREEEEEDQGDEFSSLPQSPDSRQGVSIFSDARKRSSTGSLTKSSPKQTFNRRSVLTSKSEQTKGTSQIYLDSDEPAEDFIKITLVLLGLFFVLLLTMLLINDTDRPNSVSLLVKKMNLEPLSLALRRNYYLPLKSALRETFSQVKSIADI